MQARNYIRSLSTINPQSVAYIYFTSSLGRWVYVSEWDRERERDKPFAVTETRSIFLRCVYVCGCMRVRVPQICWEDGISLYVCVFACTHAANQLPIAAATPPPSPIPLFQRKKTYFLLYSYFWRFVTELGENERKRFPSAFCLN